MPTDNPKISLYVPQQIYDRFREFQEEQHLSMSQAGILVLAEYFGLEQTIKEITEGVTIGGVSLAKFEELENKVKNLEKVVNQGSFISEPLNKIEDRALVEQTEITTKLLKAKNQNLDKILDDSQSKQFSLVEEEDREITISEKLLAKRLKLSNPVSVGNKRREFYKQDKETADKKFSEWTGQKDIDSVEWQAIKETEKKYGYSPFSKLSNELHSKLLKWIEGN